nr:uncharacterized protein LOC114825357 [Malus domestica]
MLEDRYATVSKSRINMLKTEFQTLQKGADTIDKYFSRLKSIRDQLITAGEVISNNDMIIAALEGLPREYAIIRTVILATETLFLSKSFEHNFYIKRDIDSLENYLYSTMAAMYMQGSSSHIGYSGASHDGFVGSSSQNGYSGEGSGGASS